MLRKLLPGLPVLLLALSPTCWADDESTPMMSKGQSGVALGDAHTVADCSPDGIGVGGYDLVSYRQADGPIMGSDAHKTAHKGVTYLFASDDNLQQFLARPDYYLPAYAGFCAITLALGRVTCPDFANFKIENDQLLLFEVTGFTNGRTLWNSDNERYRDLADDNFLQLIEPL